LSTDYQKKKLNDSIQFNWFCLLIEAVENCNPERMNFNGGYNCSGDSDTFNCTLNCGADGKFEHRPHPIYMCHYATGIFDPQPIPQCIFGQSVTSTFDAALISITVKSSQ